MNSVEKKYTHLDVVVVDKNGLTKVVNIEEASRIVAQSGDKFQLVQASENFIIVKKNDNLEITLPDGETLTIEDFYSYNNVEMEFLLVDDSIYTLSSESSFGYEVSSDTTLLYAQGDKETLLSMTKSDHQLYLALSEEISLPHSEIFVNTANAEISKAALIIGSVLVAGGAVALSKHNSNNNNSENIPNEDSDEDSNPSLPSIELTAQLVDSAVAGVAYYVNGASNPSGYTDVNGYFTYQAGDVVTFQVGNVILKANYDTNTIPSDKKVTLQDLLGVDRNKTSDTKVVKLAQFLQTLDADGNAENGIQIVTNSSGKAIKTNPDDINSTDDLDTNNDGKIDEAELVAAKEAYKNSNDTLLDDVATLNKTDINEDTDINALFKNTVTVKTETEVKEHLDKQLEIINEGNDSDDNTDEENTDNEDDADDNTDEENTDNEDDSDDNTDGDNTDNEDDSDSNTDGDNTDNGNTSGGGGGNTTQTSIKVSTQSELIKAIKDGFTNITIDKDIDLSEVDIGTYSGTISLDNEDTDVSIELKVTLEQFETLDIKTSSDDTVNIVIKKDADISGKDLSEANSITVVGVNVKVNLVQALKLEIDDTVTPSGSYEIIDQLDGILDADSDLIDDAIKITAKLSEDGSLNDISVITLDSKITIDLNGQKNITVSVSQLDSPYIINKDDAVFSVKDSFTHLSSLTERTENFILSEGTTIANLQSLDSKTTGSISFDSIKDSYANLTNEENAKFFTTNPTIEVEDAVAVVDLSNITDLTTAKITATIAQGDITTLLTLPDSEHNLTIKVTTPTTADASDLTLIAKKTLKSLDVTAVKTIQGTAAELAEYAATGSTLAEDVVMVITGDVAATIEELKAINEATTGTITLNNATISSDFSGTPSDLATALDGITTLTGTITLTGETAATLDELMIINNATTNTITLNDATKQTTLEGTKDDIYAALKGVVGFVGDVEVTDSLSIDEFKALDLVIEGEIIYTLIDSIETLLADATNEEILANSDAHTLTDTTTTHTDINMKTANLISKATNSVVYSYSIKDTAENIVDERYETSVTTATKVTLTNETIKVEDLDDIASQVAVTVSAKTLTGEVEDIIDFLYDNNTVLANITGLNSLSDILVSAGDDGTISSNEMASFLGYIQVFNFTGNIIIDSTDLESININFGFTKGTTTIDSTTYTTYTNSSNNSFMVKDTFTNVIVEGTLAEFETLSTLPENYVLTDDDSDHLGTLDIKQAKIVVGAKNGLDYALNFDIADTQANLDTGYGSNENTLKWAKKVLLKLEETKDFTSIELNEHIDGFDLNGYNAILSVPQADLMVTDSTESTSSFATAKVDDENKDLFANKITFDEKVTKIDLNGVSDVILTLDIGLREIIDTKNSNVKATIKIPQYGEDIDFRDTIFSDKIDKIDLNGHQSEFTLAQWDSTTFDIIDTANEDMSKATIIDSFDNLQTSTNDFDGANVVAFITKDIDFRGTTINPSISKIEVNGYDVIFSVEQAFLEDPSRINSNNRDDKFTVGNSGKYGATVTLTEDIDKSDLSIGNGIAKFDLNGYHAKVNFHSAFKIDYEVELDGVINKYVVNGKYEIKDTIADINRNIENWKIKQAEQIILRKGTRNSEDGQIDEAVAAEANELSNLLTTLSNQTISVDSGEGHLLIKGNLANILVLKSHKSNIDMKGNIFKFEVSGEYTIQELESVIFDNSTIGLIENIKDTASKLSTYTYIDKVTKKVTIEGTKAATLAELKLINDATDATITLNAATKAEAYSGTTADILAALDGLKGFTGDLTIDVNSPLTKEDFAKLDLLTTGEIYVSVTQAASAELGTSKNYALIDTMENINTKIVNGTADKIILKANKIIIEDDSISLAELKTLNDSTTATIILNDTVKAGTFSGTAADILETFDSINGFTGTLILEQGSLLTQEQLNTLTTLTTEKVYLSLAQIGDLNLEEANYALVDTVENLMNDTTHIQGDMAVIITDDISLSDLKTIDDKTNGAVTYTKVVDTIANIKADTIYIQNDITVSIVDTTENILAQIKADKENNTTMVKGASSVTLTDTEAIDLSVQNIADLQDANITIPTSYNIVDTAENILAQIASDSTNNTTIISGATTKTTSDTEAIDLTIEQIATLTNASIAVTNGYNLIDTVALLEANTSYTEGAQSITIKDSTDNIIKKTEATLVQDFKDANLDLGGQIAFKIGGTHILGTKMITFTNAADLVAQLKALDGIASATFGTDSESNKLTIKSTDVGAIQTLKIFTMAGLKVTEDVTETSTVTFKALVAEQSVTIAGLTLEATGNMTATMVAKAFASSSSNPTNGTFSGTLTDFTAGEADGANLVFTSTTANTDVTDIVISSTGKDSVDTDMQRDIDLTGTEVIVGITYSVDIGNDKFSYEAKNGDTLTGIATSLANAINVSDSYTASNTDSTINITAGAGAEDISAYANKDGAFDVSLVNNESETNKINLSSITFEEGLTYNIVFKKSVGDNEISFPTVSHTVKSNEDKQNLVSFLTFNINKEGIAVANSVLKDYNIFLSMKEGTNSIFIEKSFASIEVNSNITPKDIIVSAPETIVETIDGSAELASNAIAAGEVTGSTTIDALVKEDVDVTLTDGVTIDDLGRLQAQTTGTITYSIKDTLENINANITDGVANDLLLDSSSVTIEDSQIENDTELLSQVTFEALTQNTNESSSQAFTKIDLEEIEGISLSGLSLNLSTFEELSNLDNKTISLSNETADQLTLTAEDLFAVSDKEGDLLFNIKGESNDKVILEGWTDAGNNSYTKTGNFDSVAGDETYTVNVINVAVQITA